MEVHDFGGYRYSFVFFHKMDLQKVMDGGPWSFEQSMLIVHQLKDTEDPHIVKLQEVEIWVQIYDLSRVVYRRTLRRMWECHLGGILNQTHKILMVYESQACVFVWL